MNFNKVCEWFEDDVRALHLKWRDINHGFVCETNGLMFGDNSLYVAHRQISELLRKIERIQDAREVFIDTRVA